MKKPELAWLKDLGEKLRPLAHRYRAVLIVLLAGMLLLASGGWFGGGKEQAAAQTGQPAPFTARESTLARHSCPCGQFHHTFLCEPAVTICGVTEPFLSAFHCAASPGCVVARSFSPRLTNRLAHTGHPQPAVRDFTIARHSCPCGHSHHTSLWLPGSTSSGRRLPFFVGCHSPAISGKRAARSFSPGTTRLPPQLGQPVPLFARENTSACQVCPFGQRHHTRRLLPDVTTSGVRLPFFSSSHSSSSSVFPVRMQNEYKLSRISASPLPLPDGIPIPSHTQRQKIKAPLG